MLGGVGRGSSRPRATSGPAAAYGDTKHRNTQKPIALRLRRDSGCGC